MYKTRRLTVKFQFAQTYLNGKFPCGSDADVFVVGRVENDLLGGLGQCGITVQKPNGGVSVQQIVAHITYNP
jgi:hypothetical protein